jgi:replicative DNA helicase
MTAETIAETGYQPHPTILEAETAVAGAAMANAENADAAAEILKESDFYDIGCATVFAAACELSGSGKPVNELSVRSHLVKTGAIKAFGSDTSRLFDLIGRASVGGPEGVRHDADTVRADAVRRRIQIACGRGAAQAGRPDFEIEQIDRILDDIHAALPDQRDDRPLWISDDLDEFLESLTQPVDLRRIPTPWPDLDEKVTLRAGQLVVVGARPGGGKSIFGLNIASHAAINHQMSAMVASMEMPRPEVECRLYAAEARIKLDNLEKRTLDAGEWDRIWAATERIRDSPLVIDDQPTVTLGHLRARLKWMARTRPARVLVVDYVQLMKSTRKAESRTLEVDEFTRGLKLLAIELDLCVIALAQLNRDSEKRTSKRPIMSDLRESGSLENNADIILFPYLEPEISEGVKRLGEADIVVAKQRSGMHDIDIPLAFQGHYSRFRSMANVCD